VLTFAFELVISIAPGRVKTISAFQFAARLAMSSDIPRANPVKSVTSTTPNATPTMLINVRKGLVFRLAKTSSNIIA
jgi:hypothetical protein